MSFQSKFSNSRYPPIPNNNLYKFVPTQPTGQIYFQKNYQSKTLEFRRKHSSNSRDSGKYSSSNSQSRIINTNIIIGSPNNNFLGTSNVSHVNQQYGFDIIPGQFDRQKQLFIKEKNQLMQRVHILQNQLSIKQSMLRNKTEQNSFYSCSQTSPYASSYSIYSNQQKSHTNVNQQLKKLKQQSQKRFFKLIEKDNKCRKLQDENKKLQQQIQQYKKTTTKNNAFSDVNNYNHQLGKAILQNAQLKSQIKNKQNQIAQKIRIITQLRNQFGENSKNEHHNHGERKSLLAFKAPEIKEISSQLSRVKIQNDKLKKDVDAKAQMISFLQRKCHRFEQQQYSKIGQLQKTPLSDAYTAKQRQRYYNNRNDELERQVNSLRKQVDVLKKEKIDLEDRISQLLKAGNIVLKLEKQNQNLKQQLNSLKSAERRSSAFEQSTETPNRQLRMIKRQNIRLKQIASQLQAKNIQRQQTIQYLNERIQKYLQQILENQARLKKQSEVVNQLQVKLKQEREEKIGNKKDIGQITFKLTKVLSEVQRKQKENQTLSAKCNVVEMETNKITQQFTQMKTKLQCVLCDNNDLTHQLTRQRENLSRLEKLLNEIKGKYKNELLYIQQQKNKLDLQIKGLIEEKQQRQKNFTILSNFSEANKKQNEQLSINVQKLSEIISLKEKELQEMKKQLRDQQKSLKSYQQKQNILQTMNQQLKMYKVKINKYTIQKTEFDQQLLQKDLKIEQLQQQITTKKLLIQQQANSIISYANAISELQSRQKNLLEQSRSQLVFKTQKYQELKLELQSKQTQIQTYQKNQRGYTSDILMLKQQIKKEKSKRNNKQLQINELRQTMSKIQTKIKNLQNQVQQKKQQTQRLQAQLNEKKERQNLQELQQSQKTQKQINFYKNQIEFQKQAKQILNNELQHTKDIVVKLQKQLNNANNTISEQTKQIKRLQQEKQQIPTHQLQQQELNSGKLTFLQSTIQEKESFIQSLQEQIANSQQKTNYLNTQIMKLKGDIKILQDENTGLKILLEQQQTKYANILEIAKDKSSKAQQFEFKCDQLVKKYQQLQQQAKNLKYKMSILIQEAQVLKKQSLNIELMKETIVQLTHKISKQQSSQNNVNTNRNKQEQNVSQQFIRLTQQIQDLQNSLQVYKLDNSKLLQENINLQQLNNKLAQNIKQLNAKAQYLQKVIVQPTLKVSIDQSINDISRIQNSKLQQITSQLIFRLQQCLDRIKNQKIEKSLEMELNKIEIITNQILEIFQQEIDYYEEKLTKAKRTHKKDNSRSITTLYCDEYLDVLDLFGVDQNNQDHHQLLLSQINSFRDTIQILMNKVSNHQRQMKEVKKAKNELKKSKQMLQQQIAALEDKNYKNEQIINYSNQCIVIEYLQKMNKMLSDEHTPQSEISLIQHIKQQKSYPKLPRPKSVSQTRAKSGIQQIFSSYSIGQPQPEKDNFQQDFQ